MLLDIRVQLDHIDKNIDGGKKYRDKKIALEATVDFIEGRIDVTKLDEILDKHRGYKSAAFWHDSTTENLVKDAKAWHSGHSKNSVAPAAAKENPVATGQAAMTELRDKKTDPISQEPQDPGDRPEF